MCYICIIVKCVLNARVNGDNAKKSDGEWACSYENEGSETYAISAGGAVTPPAGGGGNFGRLPYDVRKAQDGANELPVYHLITLCRCHGVSADYFLGLSDEKWPLLILQRGKNADKLMKTACAGKSSGKVDI